MLDMCHRTVARSRAQIGKKKNTVKIYTIKHVINMKFSEYESNQSLMYHVTDNSVD